MLTQVPLAALVVLLLYISLVTSVPVTPRDVVAVGPQGNLTLVDRWRDTVGTATQVVARGVAAKNDIFNTDRSGPLSSVYRSTLAAHATTPCEPGGERKCEVAIDGFGTVGEVHFVFESSLSNIKGRSSQVMIACLCLSEECGKAVLIRPVNELTENSAGEKVKTGRRMCLYEAVEDRFSDCHTELLRVSHRERNHRPNYLRGEGNFNYSVEDPNFGDSWNATGQRGWTRDCLDAEIDQLPVADISKLKSEKPEFNVHETDPAEPHCKPPKDSNVHYFRDDDTAENECTALYDYAAAAAAHRATQQDEIAIGNRESSYVFPKPELVSDTELALSCSAAGLGLLFVWSVFRKQKFKRNATPVYTLWVFTVQVLSYGLEALPLHTALGSEISARNWISEFAFVDGTVALAKGHTNAEGSAEGSVMILTAVLGEVQYMRTREMLVASLTAFFDITVLVIIVLTIWRKVRINILQTRGVLPKATSKDPEFSSQLPSTHLPEILQTGTLLRKASWRKRRSSASRTAGTRRVPDDSMDEEVSETTSVTNERSLENPDMMGLPSVHSVTWESEGFDESVDGVSSRVNRSDEVRMLSCISNEANDKCDGAEADVERVPADPNSQDGDKEVPKDPASASKDVDAGIQCPAGESVNSSSACDADDLALQSEGLPVEATGDMERQSPPMDEDAHNNVESGNLDDDDITLQNGQPSGDR